MESCLSNNRVSCPAIVQKENKVPVLSKYVVYFKDLWTDSKAVADPEFPLVVVAVIDAIRDADLRRERFSYLSKPKNWLQLVGRGERCQCNEMCAVQTKEYKIDTYKTFVFGTFLE